MSAIDRRHFLLGSAAVLTLSACGSSDSGGSGGSGGSGTATAMRISAIPDQDPELLNRLYPLVAERFSAETGLEVTYQPVTDYTAVVRAFQIGDIHLAWMGGLTGVQARDLVPGADAIIQRDIDAEFTSLFIANRSAGLEPFDDVEGLRSLAGKTLTFGSDNSTSGRLMPQYFMAQAGFEESELRGSPGYSGSHDATLEAVANGSFEVGALNAQVFRTAEETGDVDLSDVVVLWETPGYADYHWLIRPDVDEVYGEGTRQAICDLLLDLDSSDTDDAAILELFGAESFITTKNENYDQIEAVARDQGLLG